MSNEIKIAEKVKFILEESKALGLELKFTECTVDIGRKGMNFAYGFGTIAEAEAFIIGFSMGQMNQEN